MRLWSLVAAVLVVASTSAYAQNNRRWSDPYESGIKLFDAGKYPESITQFEKAVAVDPRDAPQKYIEGVYRLDYFPHYYLALAYAELKQWQKAKENLEKARGTVPRQQRQQQARFNDAEGLIARGLTPEIPVDPRKKAFDADADTALASLNRQRYQQAIGQYDAIRSKYADLFASSDLAAKRDEAVKGYAGQLWDEGRQLLQQNKLNEAKAKLTASDKQLPGQKTTTDLLAEIKKREDDYQRLKTGAQQDSASRNYSGARDKYQQAQAADPEQFATDNLGPKLTEVIALARGTGGDGRGSGTGGGAGGGGTGGGASGGGTLVDPKVAEGRRSVLRAKELVAQGKYADADKAYSSALQSDPKNQEAADAVAKSTKFTALRDQSGRLARSKNTSAAQQALVDARALDPERFTAEGLAAVLEKLTPPPADPTRDALQKGLLALLNGKASESVAILEPVALKMEKAASLHAYLGVAYATQALSAPKPEDRTRLQNKAIEQFKLAKSAQPDYQLSNRVVSPAILSIYQDSR